MSGCIRSCSVWLLHRVDSNAGATLQLWSLGASRSAQPRETRGGVETPSDPQLCTEQQLIQRRLLKPCDSLKCFPAKCINAVHPQTLPSRLLPCIRTKASGVKEKSHWTDEFLQLCSNSFLFSHVSLSFISSKMNMMHFIHGYEAKGGSGSYNSGKWRPGVSVGCVADSTLWACTSFSS